MATTSTAIEDVIAERVRQQLEEGWTPAHDDAYREGELGRAAASYALGRLSGSAPPAFWPWQREWWKPKGRRRDLVRAGALIIAEIERLDRAGLAE